jgi:hypothetical protein
MKKIISGLVLFLMSYSIVLSCDCQPIGNFISGRFNENMVTYFDWIFLAKVMNGENNAYKIEIIEVFKGDIGENIKIINTFEDCNRNVESGETYLIYCNKVSNDSLIIDPCVRHREIYKERFNEAPPPVNSPESDKIRYEKSDKGDSMVELKRLREIMRKK